MPVPTFTCQQYYEARYPDLNTVWPTHNSAMQVTAAMALYWEAIFPSAPVPDPSFGDETLLTERQKVLISLRAAVTSLPMWLQLMAGKVKEAQADVALTKFEDRFKFYKQIGDEWAKELLELEGREGLAAINPVVPGWLQKIPNCGCSSPGVTSSDVVGVIFERDMTIVPYGDGSC